MARSRRLSRLFRTARDEVVKTYEPTPRRSHHAASLGGLVYSFAGYTNDRSAAATTSLSTHIEALDPVTEMWLQRETAGDPPLGLRDGAFAASHSHLYHYGGFGGSSRHGDLSRFCPATMLWTKVSRHSAGGPMKKDLYGMVCCGDILGLFGGFGKPTGPAQPGSTFIKSEYSSDGSGRSDEFHIFDINKGVWSSPATTGTRPSPRSHFSFTEIDDHRAVLFAGTLPGGVRANDTYLVDLQLMEWSKLDLVYRGPVPVERYGHAACCINIGDDHPLLLVTGGADKDRRVLKDAWLLDIVARRWKELQMPEGFQPRYCHSLTATSLAPGITVATAFGGWRNVNGDPIAETTLLQFEQQAGQWGLTDVTLSSQLGHEERVRDKRKKMEAAGQQRAPAQPQATSSAQASQERQQVLEQRAQAAERREQEAVRRVQLAERGQHEAEARAREAEKRAHSAEERVREVVLQLHKLEAAPASKQQEFEQLLREAERKHRELEQQFREAMIRQEEKCSRVRQDAEVTVLEVQASLRGAEQRLHASERLCHEAAGREHAAMQRIEALQTSLHQAERLARGAETELVKAQEKVIELEAASQSARQTTDDAHSRIKELTQSLQESEARTAAQGAACQTAEDRVREVEGELEVLRTTMEECQERTRQLETQWVIERREIQLTEEEKGRGGWAVVRVANFRGLRVAAKCLHDEISDYYSDLFTREMNMAARLRHPNLVQFIGATRTGKLIILTELMPTTLRAVLERKANERKKLEQCDVTSISLDVARALNYLHLMQPEPLIHRDISSANVLLEPLPNNSWKAKVSDYGSVNLQRQLRTVGPGSPVYAAPEANAPDQQSPKMDIFSFGILLIEMCTARFPEVAARQRLSRSIQHPHFVELIGQCMSQEIASRPSASEIISQLTQLHV